MGQLRRQAALATLLSSPTHPQSHTIPKYIHPTASTARSHGMHMCVQTHMHAHSPTPDRPSILEPSPLLQEASSRLSSQPRPPSAGSLPLSFQVAT